MTDYQYVQLMMRLDKLERQTNYKGHGLIIIMLLALLLKAAN